MAVEAMADERLAEINQLTADVIAGRICPRFDEETAWLAIIDLRREVERLRAASVIPAGYFDTSKLLTEVKVLREIAQIVADGEVYHDSKGGMLMVAEPDVLLVKARALRALMERG